MSWRIPGFYFAINNTGRAAISVNLFIHICIHAVDEKKKKPPRPFIPLCHAHTILLAVGLGYHSFVCI